MEIVYRKADNNFAIENGTREEAMEDEQWEGEDDLNEYYGFRESDIDFRNKEKGIVNMIVMFRNPERGL